MAVSDGAQTRKSAVNLPKASCVQSSGPAEPTSKLEMAKLEERRQKIHNLITQEKQVKLMLRLRSHVMLPLTITSMCASVES